MENLHDASSALARLLHQPSRHNQSYLLSIVRPPPVWVPASMIEPLLAQPRPGPQPVQLHQPREQILVQAGLGPAVHSLPRVPDLINSASSHLT